MSNLLTRDSTPVARTLAAMFGRLSLLRALILDGRPGLMRMAWVFRKFVWSITWAFIVVMRLWPRRVPVPSEDNPIRLIPAPESYPDFRSPALVVPSDVPRREMTLPGALTVQILHVLQDVYPVISSHQPTASSDPEKRLREAYSWVYRLVKAPPAWPADLAGAHRRGTLLGALAVGGPFAKLLERKRARSNEYLIDLEYLRAYPVRDGLARLGCQIHFVERAGSCCRRRSATTARRRRPVTRSGSFCSGSRSARSRRPQGAAIMKKFQTDLRDLQTEMEREPVRHWRIYPKDLEASVSA